MSSGTTPPEAAIIGAAFGKEHTDDRLLPGLHGRRRTGAPSPSQLEGLVDPGLCCRRQ